MVVPVAVLLFFIVVASKPIIALLQRLELQRSAGFVDLLVAVTVVVVKQEDIVVVVVIVVVVPLQADLSGLSGGKLSGIGGGLVEVEGLFGAAPSVVAKLLAAFGDGGVSSGRNASG